MTVTHFYSPTGAAQRKRPAVATANATPLILPTSARLLEEHRHRAVDLGRPKRNGGPAAPEARGPDPQPQPAEGERRLGDGGGKTVDAQEIQASTGTTISEISHERLLPVRWTPAPGCLILVARARGGVGATSLAVNLALEMRRKRASRLSRERKKVALVDFDVQFGTVASSLDLADRGGLLKLLQLPRDPDTQAVRSALVKHESGLKVLAAPINPIPLEALDGPRVAAIIDALMTDNDVVIVDMPPALVTWIEPLLSRATRLLMVTNLAVPSVTSARRMLNILREDAPELVVESVVSRERKPIILSKLHRQAADAIGAPLSYWLPDETRNARLALDRGEPMTTFASHSAWSRAVRRIAQSLDRALLQRELQR